MPSFIKKGFSALLGIFGLNRISSIHLSQYLPGWVFQSLDKDKVTVKIYYRDLSDKVDEEVYFLSI